MGHIHHETINQNRGTHEWENISFSNVEVIKGLIKNRSELDEMYYVKKFASEQNPLDSNGVPTFYQVIINTYLDLDNLIEKASLTEEHRKLIVMFFDGNTSKDIAELWGKDERIINKMLDTICNRIKEQNDRDWYDWIETSGLVKTKSNFKQCSKCKKWKRQEDFKFDKTNNRYKSQCRSCEDIKKTKN